MIGRLKVQRSRQSGYYAVSSTNIDFSSVGIPAGNASDLAVIKGPSNPSQLLDLYSARS